MKNPPDPQAVQDVSAETGIPPAFIEKDWYAIQVLSVIADHPFETVRPIFSGGTSLSKGYGLIKRFSEDLDFKISTAEALDRPKRRNFRDGIIEIFANVDGVTLDKASITTRDATNIFGFNLVYPQRQTAHNALRPHLQIEMSFHAPALPHETRPLRSFITEVANGAPDTHIACINPVETAADKMSALIWRVLSKDRSQPIGNINNEPAMIRHLHDLCALSGYTLGNSNFITLVKVNYEADKIRGGLPVQYTLKEAAKNAYRSLQDDKQYEFEYDQFVNRVSYDDGAGTPFAAAMDSLAKVIHLI